MTSLLGTIQQSANALGVAQTGLQVVGNNISNANTDGFIRQNLVQASAQATRVGGLILGHGVRPIGTTQQIDQQLFERMINARTALSGSESIQDSYRQLEELTNDLGDSGLNSQLSRFDAAIQELSTQPNDPSLRDFVILQAQNLSTVIRQNRQDALDRRELANANLGNAASEINKLIERVATANVEIATLEAGSTGSDAVGLRDQRYRDLEELAQYVNINFQEQASGVVNVFVGGDYLVSNGNFRPVYSAFNQKIGGNEVRIIETDSPLAATGGLVGAASRSRDEVFGSYVDSLDAVAAGLIRSVNEIHSDAQGGIGHEAIQSTYQADSGVPLANAGLAFEPDNGTFDVDIVDPTGEVISTHRVAVRNLNQVSDSTVSSIVASLDAIDGLVASVDAKGLISIESEGETARFVFRDDNSGFLAAAGINTFFTGRSGLDIDVNPILLENSDYLGVSKSGIGRDTDALAQLIGIVNEPIDHLDNQSIRNLYEQTITGAAQRVSLQQSSTQGLSDLYATLRSGHLAITGVNIDEESIKMITYQRAFQASSRVISTASEMLELLVNL